MTPSASPSPWRRSRWAQFLFFPLIVAAGCLLVFGLFSWMGQDNRTPEDLLALMRSAGGRERWQAAQELSQRVVADEGLRSDPVLGSRALSLFAVAREEDPEIARFLARAIGLMAPEGAGEALAEALGSEDASLRIQAALALPQVGGEEWILPLERRLADEDPGVRKAAAWALGNLAGEAEENGEDVVRTLVPLLGDREVDVRWNAALALATLGSESGTEVLSEMLDRQHLNEVSDRVRARDGRGMSESEVTDVMLNGIRAVARLGSPVFTEVLERLWEGDESPRVQEAARLALAGIQVEHRVEER